MNRKQQAVHNAKIRKLGAATTNELANRVVQQLFQMRLYLRIRFAMKLIFRRRNKN